MTALQKRMATIGALVVLALGSGWFYYAFQGGDPSSARLRPDDAKMVAAGQRVYAETCAACHGANLAGEEDWQTRDADGLLPAPPHDASGHTWHHPDQVLFDLTKHGLQKYAGPDYKTNMPAYQGVLSDDEILAVLSFIKSRWPEEIRQRHDQINANARK